MKVTLDFWCPIMRSFGTDFQSSDCGHHVATSSQGGSAAVRHWTPKCRLPTLQPLSGLLQKELMKTRWGFKQRCTWLHQPHCAWPPASHLFLGAARAEFKALHGEGFHDTSLQVALTPKPFVHCCQSWQMVSLEFLKEKEKKPHLPMHMQQGSSGLRVGAAAGCLAGQLGKWAAQGQRGRVGETGTGIGTS